MNNKTPAQQISPVHGQHLCPICGANFTFFGGDLECPQCNSKEEDSLVAENEEAQEGEN